MSISGKTNKQIKKMHLLLVLISSIFFFNPLVSANEIGIDGAKKLINGLRLNATLTVLNVNSAHTHTHTHTHTMCSHMPYIKITIIHVVPQIILA